MEFVFKNKIEEAEEKLQSFKQDNGLVHFDEFTNLIGEFNLILSSASNFKEKLLSHLLLAKLYRVLFETATKPK